MAGGIPPQAMQAINWVVMGISFILLAATAVFGKEVLDTFCANMQYDGTADDVVSEESFTLWQMTMWGGLGACIAPACVAAVLLFYQLGCAKSAIGSAIALSAILALGLVAMSFGVSVQAHFKGMFAGLLAGILMMGIVLATGQGKASAGSVMVQVGTAFFLFGGMATALGAFAISRVVPCNEHRGCFASVPPPPPEDDTAGAAPDSAADSATDDAEENPFTTVCDWTCCDSTTSTGIAACDAYKASDTSGCGECQPCLIDTTMNTKLWACTGTGIALAVFGLVMFIAKFAAPVP